MADSVGLGLLLNILFWTVAVLVAVGVGSLAAIDWFPGRKQKTRSESPKPRAGVPDTQAHAEGDAASKRYRKAA